MSRDRLRLFLVVSLLLNISVLATTGYLFASRAGRWVSPFGTTMPRDRFLFEELALKPEQVRAMRAKAMPFRAEIDRRRGEIAAARKELIGLLRAAEPAAGAVDAAIARVSALQEEMQKKITGHMLEEKALLDREQQRRFFDLIEGAMEQGGEAACRPDGAR